MKTPHYIFYEKLFVYNLLKYKTYGSVFYPIKANDNPLIIKNIIQMGCSFEVDSVNHMKELVETYKVDPQKIIFSFPLKKISDVKKATSLGIRKYVIDCFEEYEKIRKFVKNPLYLLRFNANEVIKELTPMQDKWGFSINNLKKIYKLIKDRDEKILGISFYLTSEINCVENFEKVFNFLGTLDLDNLDVIDIGGGISINMLERMTASLELLKSKFQCKEIVIEPGRHLLEPCMDMKVSIIAKKNSSDGKQILFIDAGIYNGLLDVIIKNKRLIINDELNEMRKTPFYLCGFSSDVSDFLGEYFFSESLDIGDKLIIKNCGAYSAVMSTRFYAQKPLQTYIVKNE